MSGLVFRGWRGLALGLCALVMMLSPASVPTAQSPGAAAVTGASPVVPNFDLGARWTSAKVGKLVFDTTVTPRWMQTGDRFWYTYQSRDGRRFFMVDPLKKERAKAPLFDHAKVAAALTSITRQPYDAQHLPFSNIKFAKNDAVFEFDVQVPRDADIVTTKKKITTTQEPDEDEDPQQQQQQQEQQQDQQQDDTTQQQEVGGTQDKNARTAATAVVWSPDSKKFTLNRRDERKVKDLWVINSLANPRPTLESYRYSMPGEENIGNREMFVFEVAAKKQITVKADRFKDQSLSVATAPTTQREREDARTLGGGQGQGGQGGGGQGGPGAGAGLPAKWAS